MYLDDFRHLDIVSGGKTRTVRAGWRGRDKGHSAELSVFVEALRSGGDFGISLRVAAETTMVTLAAIESVRTGEPEELRYDDLLRRAPVEEGYAPLFLDPTSGRQEESDGQA
jgi:hypothetical protein